jgi:uncharacterized glyoxalase superfamily protein PhnB
MAVKGSVPAPGAIVPHLVVSNAAVAVAFYRQAFAAHVLYRSKSPSGHGEHVHLKIWASLIQVSSEEPGQGHAPLLASPETLNGSTCVFQIAVPDVDEAYEHAVKHGAVPKLPPTDMFWGDRYAWIRDPFGHMWALCTIQEILTPAQVADRMRGEFGAVAVIEK